MQYISLFLSLIFITMPAHAFDLSQKLAECEIHFKAKRLTTGEGGTALACYEAVLKKYPTNSEAWRGLDRIKARYQSWMNRAIRRGQQSKVQTYQRRIGLVDEVKTRIQAIQARLRQEDELEKTRLQAILNTPTSTKPEVFVQLGHSDHVNAVAFSPDGKLALSGSRDKTLKLWEVKSGREIRSFTGHSSYVLAVAFSPDGKLALSGSDDLTLRLWEVSSGREIRSFTGHSYPVLGVAFSPDGKLALSGGYKTLKLWEVSSGREIRSFTGHSSYVLAVAFSPDGKLALSGSDDLTLRLWEVSSGREIRSFTGHSYPVLGVAFSPDGKLALSGGYKTLKLWEVSSGREIRSFTGHSSYVLAVAFSPDGKLALSGSMDKTLKLWEVKSGREIRSLTGHSSFVFAVAFSPDGKLALSGSMDKTLKLWEVKSGREIRSLTGHSDSVSAVAFSPDGKLALSGSWDDTLKLWEVKSGREIRSFTGHSFSVYAVAFSPDGKLALSGSGDHTLKLWEVTSGREIRSLTGHSSSVTAVAFSPDGKLALSGSYDGTTRLWNVQTGKEIAQMLAFEDGEWVTITPEGYYTASLNGAKYINVSIGTQSYNIDQYEAIYHRPGIVKLAIKLGDTQQAIAQATHGAQPIQIAQVQPPKIWFVSPQKGYETQRTKITVKVETQIIVDNAESLTFKVNGRPVGKEKGKRDRAKVTGSKVQTYSPLQIGENWIEVEVRGQAGAVERRNILAKAPSLKSLTYITWSRSPSQLATQISS
jgi:WD40 repeat protein